MPMAVVLHLPDNHESRLAELFDHRLDLDVREARDKEMLEPGVVYFAPSGYHLSIEADRSFSLSCEDRVNYARPSIDVLMLSAADAYGKALCAILCSRRGQQHDGAWRDCWASSLPVDWPLSRIRRPPKWRRCRRLRSAQ